MKKVKIGDRVYWKHNKKIVGTIKNIFLSEYPFYVEWDKGTDDWYKGSDLELQETYEVKE